MLIEIIDAQGAVINTIEADEAFARANYPAGTWRLGAAPAPAHEDRRITRLAFLERLTDAEAVALDLASSQSTAQAAALRRHVAKVSAAMFIDLSRADTRAGVQALERVGLLAAGRALEILDAPINDIERYKD